MSMSDKDQSQPPLSGHEQTRDSSAVRPQAERASGTESGGSPRGRSSSSSGGGSGRHGGRRRHGQQSPSQQRRTESSLDMQELRELMDLFTSHGLTDFEFENEEIRVRLSRNLAPQAASNSASTASSEGFHLVAPAAASGAPPAAGASTTASASHAATDATRGEEKAEDLHIITSPIVGTFYRSPSPTSEPFVRQGSSVEPDTIVCIIEAMKLMNEIQSETTGVVEKIYVENGQPVEYGQPLFGIKR